MSREFKRTVKVSELPPGTMKTVEVEGEYVLLANTEGKYYAMGAICTHKQWDLSEGTLEGHFVTCAGHGSVWDLTKGTAEFDELLEPEPLYDVQVKEGYIYVSKRE
jgi:nitrite reductase/ring-hydroxylating ferredoxin subunit